MSSRFVETLRPALAALRLTLADPELRPLMVAYLAGNAGRWAFMVTTLVLAYQEGGAVAIGILGLARFVTPTIVAPFTGLPTVRWRPEVVLRGANVIRTLAIGLAIWSVAAGLPIELLYLAVAIEAGAGALHRPLHMALLPAIVQTPAQLIAANVASSAAEGLGTFLGPALAGILLVTVGPVGAMVAVMIIYGLGVLAIARVHVPAVGRSDVTVRAVMDQLSAGVRAAIHLPGPRVLLVDLGLQTLVRGLLTVLLVVAAIETLHMGEGGVGTLNAALGLGGLVGAVLAITLAGRQRLTPAFVVALAAWGAPLAVIGLVPQPAVAIGAMLAVGLANSFVDVAAFPLLQRTTPNESRIAVLGLVDSVAGAGVAVGGIVAPVLLDGLGITGAMIVAGLILPATALLSWPLLRRVNEGGPAVARRVDLLRGEPLFTPLSLATVEHLASHLTPLTAEDGAWLMREGEPGLDYVLVETGDIEVLQGGHRRALLGPGAGVGEIALLRDVPRTATVSARTDAVVFALDRESFLTAVSGHRFSERTLDNLATERSAREPAAPMG